MLLVEIKDGSASLDVREVLSECSCISSETTFYSSPVRLDFFVISGHDCCNRKTPRACLAGTCPRPYTISILFASLHLTKAHSIGLYSTTNKPIYFPRRSMVHCSSVSKVEALNKCSESDLCIRERAQIAWKANCSLFRMLLRTCSLPRS